MGLDYLWLHFAHLDTHSPLQLQLQYNTIKKQYNIMRNKNIQCNTLRDRLMYRTADISALSRSLYGAEILQM